MCDEGAVDNGEPLVPDVQGGVDDFVGDGAKAGERVGSVVAAGAGCNLVVKWLVPACVIVWGTNSGPGFKDGCAGVLSVFRARGRRLGGGCTSTK